MPKLTELGIDTSHTTQASGTAKLGRSQAIGRSRGGRTTKIHALTDTACRPVAFLLTGGQVADCTAAERCWIS